MGRAHLTDDERLRVRVLRLDAGWTFSRIAQVTGYGATQVRNAMRSGTVAKRSGRPTAMTPEQEAELVRFVTASRGRRSMSYAGIAEAVLGGQFGDYAIRNALRRHGFKRSGPVLRQAVREEGTPAGERVSVAGAPPVGAPAAGGPGGPMEGVAGEESPSDDEMLTDDEGAGEQAPGEGGASSATRNGATGVDQSVARDLAAAVNAVNAVNAMGEQPARHPAAASGPANAVAAPGQAGQTPAQAGYTPQAFESRAAQTPTRTEMSQEPSQAPSYQTGTPRQPSQAPSTVQMETPREPSLATSYQTEIPRQPSQAPMQIEAPREPSQAPSVVHAETPRAPSQAPSASHAGTPREHP